ncbi:lipopolysaccharide biosynthesis protein [Akkermansia muciniphila]|uniref:lipopolysaccharide biosynthesis protein n=1 Tax=Akkermansia muciniphila TaxID=239935 RepID=UPI001BFFB362|nr:sugar transporter [Akkermansia muciniphila]
MRESRVKKSLQNARVNLVFYILILCISFFSRKIFLNCLGADFVGLTGTLLNLLNFLNLAELGVSTAIGYVLYKPLFDQDKIRINEIISVLGYMYRWIGLVIIGAGLVLACFLPLIFPSTGFSYGVIYFAYFSFLASSLIGYFANYRQTLLGADQRNYVVAVYFQTATIIKILFQMLSAWYTGSYYLWIAIELLFGGIYSFILNWKINQVYPWLKGSVALGRQLFRKYPEVIRYTRQLFVHRIGAFAQFQITPLLVYAFVSLQMVAYFGNYSIITDKLFLLVNNLLGSTEASVGNLIAEGNTAKIRRVFNELFSLRMLIAGTICFALYQLLEPFISLWLGSGYILSREIMILVIINLFIAITRGVTDQFLYGYGLFWDIWAPLAESVINITVAVIGGYLWGLPGILLGGISSLMLIVGIWKPFMLYTWGFRENVMFYWLQFGYQLALILAPAVLMSWVWRYIPLQPSLSFLNWFTCAFLMVVSYGGVTVFLMYCGTAGMRSMVHRAWSMAGSRLRLLWKK